MVITIESRGVYCADIGRESALRKSVIMTPCLRREFHESYGDEFIDHKDFAEKINNFIKQKGIRIVDEKPSVRVSDNRYKVDVSYRIDIGSLANSCQE